MALSESQWWSRFNSSSLSFLPSAFLTIRPDNPILGLPHICLSRSIMVGSASWRRKRSAERARCTGQGTRRLTRRSGPRYGYVHALVSASALRYLAQSTTYPVDLLSRPALCGVRRKTEDNTTTTRTRISGLDWIEWTIEGGHGHVYANEFIVGRDLETEKGWWRRGAAQRRGYVRTQRHPPLPPLPSTALVSGIQMARSVSAGSEMSHCRVPSVED
ncbi:hypothetical protein B0H13DRAFT_51387 [Mycena leptocephala]|nr:hypothetical protein B0H13DRAFT_51387 [Mycena leptocephala]